ncbi:hypothetical protein GCM10023205_05820 [Yinghuangia aomiensis]|uniref:Uncharacterized protein n=1 Tax=Yinghuangia aomiensis TaxID=676205 RepID=A0ABP9GMW4_9ACTN
MSGDHTGRGGRGRRRAHAGRSGVAETTNRGDGVDGAAGTGSAMPDESPSETTMAWSVRPGGPEFGAAADPYDGTGTTPQTPYAASRSGSGTPDWNAMADRETRRRRRRKQRLRTAATLLGLALVSGGITAWALWPDGGTDKQPASAPTAGGKPTFKPVPVVAPPPGSAAVLADPAKDTAPFTAEGLFPDATIAVQGRVYTVVARQLDNTCADAANPSLGMILRRHQCVQLVRITASGPDGVAATVAVASFANPGDAQAAAGDGNADPASALTALPGGPVQVLCPDPVAGTPGVVCLRQTNSLGRYGIFLIGGYPGTENRITTGSDPKVDQMGADLDAAAQGVLTARGEQRSQEIYNAAKSAAEKALNN